MTKREESYQEAVRIGRDMLLKIAEHKETIRALYQEREHIGLAARNAAQGTIQEKLAALRVAIVSFDPLIAQEEASIVECRQKADDAWNTYEAERMK